MYVLPSSNDGCPVVLSPDIPITSWWSFCGERQWSGDEVLQRGSLDLNSYWQECHKLARRAQFFRVQEGQEGACLQAPVCSSCNWALCNAWLLCQYVSQPKFVNIVKETGSRFQLPMCRRSEERELVDAPERVTSLALETWNWDATSTSNDAKLNLWGSIWQIAVSSTHHKNQVHLYIFLCNSKESILWVGSGSTEISQS